MKPLVRKLVFAIVIAVAVVGTLAGIKAMQFKKMIAGAKTYAPPPETVSSFVARPEQWQGTLNAIASVTAAQGVTVAPEIAGTVKEIAFESGAVVKKGEVLVRLDTSSEVAQLAAAEAQLDLARINLARAKELRAAKTVSQSELDTAEATMKQYAGNADTIRATIQKKTLVAPFDGRLGIRQVNLGQYVDVGKPIVSLQSLSPVYVDFSLPQQDLPLLKAGMKVRLRTDAFPDRSFDGTLTAINPDLDASTRSVGLQATFENQDQSLRPGMFARAEVLLEEQREVLVIPITSVLSNPYGDSVYVIESKQNEKTGQAGLTVRQQFIRPGTARGDYLSVDTGLKAGDKVVSAGAFKLRNGMAVVENNNLVPKAAESPKPADS